MFMFTCLIAAQVQRSISDQERPRADSEQMMSALGLDPDLYKVFPMMIIVMMIVVMVMILVIVMKFFHRQRRKIIDF